MVAAIGAVAGQAGAPPQAGGPPQMNEVAKLLGLSSSELRSELQSGKTLSELASEKGISNESLLKTIETSLSAHKPTGAPALSSTELTQMASNIANGTPPSAPPPQGVSGKAQSSTTTLAQSLGIEPSALLSQLEGGGLESLLPQAGYTSEGSGSQQTGLGGIAFNQYA